MFDRNNDDAARLARLEEENRKLREQLAGNPPSNSAGGHAASRRKPAQQRKRKQERVRSQTFVLAPGHITTTLPGSLYNTTLRSLAMAGKLELHGHWFSEFQKNPTADAARKLLEEIGVYRPELEQMVYKDGLFREHQQRRTRMWKNRGARGDAQARAILKDPDIADGHGRWRGDLNEAISTLYVGRNPRQWATSKNVRILKRAGVMFDRAVREGVGVIYLYPRKFHGTFRRARVLAGE
ncbi:MAG TPA: hypothetical protein VGP72_05450 [Planctomycetota bacterium]|jgi:ribosomal protein S16